MSRSNRRKTISRSDLEDFLCGISDDENDIIETKKSKAPTFEDKENVANALELSFGKDKTEIEQPEVVSIVEESAELSIESLVRSFIKVLHCTSLY